MLQNFNMSQDTNVHCVQRTKCVGRRRRKINVPVEGSAK
jgi:hypothetical protein